MGTVVCLRPILETDWPFFGELLTDTQVGKTYMLPEYDCLSAAHPLFMRLMELSRQQARYVRCIEAAGVPVGLLNDTEIQNGVIELGWAIHSSYWNRGYATGAVRLAIEDLFRLGYREVTAGAFSENAASIQVMKKCGMERQNRTEEIEYRNKTHCCVFYGIQNIK